MANSKDNISKYATSFIGFDEASGNVYDNIGGYTGTIYNAPTRVTGWNGEGYAMSFNGSNQYVRFNSKMTPLGKKSIRFKIKQSTPYNKTQAIIANSEGTGAYGNQFYLNPANELVITSTIGVSGSPRYVMIVNFAPYINNQWHDILLTWNGTTSANSVKLYIDDMANPIQTATATSLETVQPQDNLSIGGNVSVAPSTNLYPFLGQLDQIEIYDRVISPIHDKYLVLHNNQYKYHDGVAWQTTSNTEANFIQYGMSNLNHITETQWLELTGNKSLVMWSDFEDKKYAHAVLNAADFTAKDLVGEDPEVIYYTESNVDQITIETEVDPYSVYDYISDMPAAVVYTESTDDIAISTSTEPFTLYDEFSDEVEVLYYTDDEAVTEASLEITANWSPLDEIEGDFEVVTWTDEPADTAQRQLEIEGLHPHEYVPMTNWIDVKNLVGISIKNVTGIFAPFLIEKKSDPKRYTYYEGFFYPTTEDSHNIHNYGMTPDKVNKITQAEWKDFLDGEEEIKFHFLFSNRSIGTVSKSATLDVIHQVGQIQVLRDIIKSTPTANQLELEAAVYSMAGRLESIERINLNNLLELELRTSILMKMPLIQSKEMIIETFDDNEYEVHQTVQQQVEVPSTEVDEDGNPLPSTWDTVTVQKPTDYDTVQAAFLNEFKVALPINISDDAKKLILQISGNDVELFLTDGVITKTIVDLYNEEVDVSVMNKEALVLQANGQTGSTFKGVAYTWT